MNKLLYIFLVSIAPFVFSCKNDITGNVGVVKYTQSQNIKDWEGKYFISINGEKLEDGSVSGRIWKFSIKNGLVTLVTESYHEPIFCDGNYSYEFDKDILNLYYNGPTENCRSLEPSFSIKKEKGEFFISSPDFYDTDKGKWHKLTKE
jgi:hypothetical protein